MVHNVPSSRSLHLGARGLMLLMLALPAGCTEEVDVGSLEELSLQPTQRFVIGHTFYLPAPAEGRWILASAPEANTNGVVPGADGYARFTPVVPGDYEFVVEGSEERRTLTAVEQAPYEQYNYYQTSSMAQVGDELWVANLFDPHINRVDPTTGEVLGTIRVGPWPSAIAHVEGLDVALVAHKAGDTVGFVDLESGQLVDALWVGDEPAEIVLSPDGATAYVSLATESAVAVVDVARREVTGRVATNVNPTSMVLSSDGSTLYVASYRSAVSTRQQYGSDPRNDEQDIAIVDTASLEVTGYIGDAGATIGGLLLTDDRLYVAVTRVQVEVLTTAEDNAAFEHTVAAYDLQTLAEVAAVDLGRQESSEGWAVRPFGMALAGNTLWVTTEGSDLVVGLDPSTLAETTRFEAPGRPRTILTDGDQLFVHGAQTYQVTVAGSDGTVASTIQLTGDDPRPETVREGQWLYTGTGAVGGANHGCADCHVDGLTDGNAWTAGFATSASRPMFWLEGTAPIGWEGDAYGLWSYLWGSPGPTVGATLTNDLHLAFYDYLASLVPPPMANGLTNRDGSPTELAERGRELFEGKAACAGCHAGPLTTGGLLLPEGGTQDDHPIVVPSLIGSYRHTFWLVDGSARTMAEAVAAMLPLSGATLDEGEIDDVARYLDELTARELFVLTSAPKRGETHARNDGPITVTLSHPAFDDPANLALVELRTATGELVDATVEADGRHLTLTPAAPLQPGGSYEITLATGFEAFNELTLPADEVIGFTVAQAPGLRLEGDYVLTVHHPNLDFEAGRYDDSVTFPIPLSMTATPNSYGTHLFNEINEGFTPEYDVVIEGDVAHFPPFAFPAGPGFYNRSFPTEITLVDDDGDGVADRGESTLTLKSPGLEANGVRWEIVRDTGEPTECSGQEGTHEIDLMTDGAGLPTIDWSADVNALGYYVTDEEAAPPAGPGPVMGGVTYWALATQQFPAGFVGPVVYGEVPTGADDVSEDSGAPLGGADLPPSSCVKLSVVFNDFTTTTLRYETPAQ